MEYLLFVEQQRFQHLFSEVKTSVMQDLQQMELVIESDRAEQKYWKDLWRDLVVGLIIWPHFVPDWPILTLLVLSAFAVSIALSYGALLLSVKYLS
jgi:hypothetical protein